MKLLVSTLLISLCISSNAFADNETDTMNMTDEPVKVIKKYNGRWKGWSDGCVNCDKSLAVSLYAKKPKPAPKKQAVTQETQPPTEFRAPIKQGYCECNCKPLKDKTTEVPAEQAPVTSAAEPK